MEMVWTTGDDRLDAAGVDAPRLSGGMARAMLRKALDLDGVFALTPRPIGRGAFSGLAPRAAAARNPAGIGRTRVEGEEHAGGAGAVATPAELAEWLKAVAECGDRDAFARLHRHFAPRLAGFLSRAGATAAQTEDLVQETMFAVWRKAGLYHPAQGGVVTWVFVIARNLRIDMLRRRSNREMAALDGFDRVDEAPNGEEALLAGERERRLHAALDRLSAEQRDVLRAAYFADKPQSEIAEELGVPLGTVKSRMRLALSHLRKLIEDKP